MEVYTIVFWRHAGEFVGRIAEVSGIISQGATLAELMDNIAVRYPLVREPGAKLILVPATAPEYVEREVS